MRLVVAAFVTAGLAVTLALKLSQDRPAPGAKQVDEAMALLANGIPITIPDSTISMLTTKATAALQKNDFLHAVKIMIALGGVNGTTPEQHVRVKNAVQNVKLHLAEAASAGNTNAIEAIAYFKSNSTVGR